MTYSLPPQEPPDGPEADLDVLIRTELRDLVAMSLAKSLMEEAGIPFTGLDQYDPTGRGALGWRNVRVPREKEAKAREILESVEEIQESSDHADGEDL